MVVPTSAMYTIDSIFAQILNMLQKVRRLYGESAANYGESAYDFIMYTCTHTPIVDESTLESALEPAD